MKNYLISENERNALNQELFTRIIEVAFDQPQQVMIGHHLEYGAHGQLPVEIPSADCLIFDRFIMTQVFGYQADIVMRTLATLEVEERDRQLERFFNDPNFRADSRIRAQERGEFLSPGDAVVRVQAG